MNDPKEFRGKTVLITGGGQGLGRVYARTFAKAGAIPIIAELNMDNARAVVSEIEDEGGVAHAFETDVSSEASVEDMVAGTLKQTGRIDILVNNAAIFTTLGRRPFYEIPLEEWAKVIDVNINGCFICSKAVVPAMKEANWGRIIMVSSSTVAMGAPNFTHYVTSKSALLGFARSAARELGKHGITVNALLPGATSTEVDNPGRTEALDTLLLNWQCVPRLAVPEDLLGAVFFLASEASGFMTGQSMMVDGGYSHI